MYTLDLNVLKESTGPYDMNPKSVKWTLFNRGKLPNTLACFSYFVYENRWLLVFGKVSLSRKRGYGARYRTRCAPNKKLKKGGQSWKSLSASKRDNKKYTDRIWICDLQLLFDENRKRNKSVEECIWTESKMRLPEPCNGVGLAFVPRKHEMHVFGGLNGANLLHTHEIYDVRDILKGRFPAKGIKEISE